MRELVTILSHQRHDILNHMQVILGYLKMGRYDQCEEYIQRFIQSTTRESIVTALGQDDLTAFLLTFNALNKDIILEVEIPNPFSFTRLEGDMSALSQWMISLVTSFQNHGGDNQGEPSQLILTLHYQEDSLTLSADFSGLLNEEWEVVYQESKEQAENWGGRLTGYIREEKETFIEWIFPIPLKDKR